MCFLQASPTSWCGVAILLVIVQEFYANFICNTEEKHIFLSTSIYMDSEMDDS